MAAALPLRDAMLGCSRNTMISSAASSEAAPRSMGEKEELESLAVAELMEYTNFSWRECWNAFHACNGDVAAAGDKLCDLMMFRNDWMSQIDLNKVGDQMGDINKLDQMDGIQELAVANVAMSEKVILRICSSRFLSESDLGTFLGASSRVNSLHDAAIVRAFSGQAISSTSCLQRVARGASRCGHKYGVFIRQVYARPYAPAKKELTPVAWPDLGFKVGSGLVAFDVDFLMTEELFNAMPQLVCLRHLRVLHLSDVRNELGPKVNWPSSIKDAALPGSALTFISSSSKPPERLLLILRSSSDTFTMAGSLKDSLNHVEEPVHELHLVDISKDGLLTLQGMFSRDNGFLRDAPLRRLLLYRMPSANRFEGCFRAMKVSLPNLEELFAVFKDCRDPNDILQELRELRQHRSGTLCKIVVSNQSVNGAEAVESAGEVKTSAADCSIVDVDKYDFRWMSPSSISDNWMKPSLIIDNCSWSCFGQGNTQHPLHHAPHCFSQQKSFHVF
eukprot:TRINITY_DN67312_c0_g1_i1.p1 TRINITY_DN67312_c0_g1~~TRINITY_DN67312_c0_g1_i1.p1  ORF type:complete len:504 (-),score=71.45 TRINITY_DN67312_c0_g1_i1:248-1759(-)